MKHFFIFIFIWTKHAHFLLFWIFNGWIASSKKLNSEFKDQKIILGKLGDQRDQLLDLCSFTLFEITYKCKAMKEKQFSTSFFISLFLFSFLFLLFPFFLFLFPPLSVFSFFWVKISLGLAGLFGWISRWIILSAYCDFYVENWMEPTPLLLTSFLLF